MLFRSCKNETTETHEYDSNACVPCASTYFQSIKPPLTLAMDGLTPKEKSIIIKRCIVAHNQKEKAYEKYVQEAKASCHKGSLQHNASKKGFS